MRLLGAYRNSVCQFYFLILSLEKHKAYPDRGAGCIIGFFWMKRGGEKLIADKGYNLDKAHSQVRKKGMAPVIPKRANSKQLNQGYDAALQ